jgi:hypothetical protein
MGVSNSSVSKSADKNIKNFAPLFCCRSFKTHNVSWNQQGMLYTLKKGNNAVLLVTKMCHLVQGVQ